MDHRADITCLRRPLRDVTRFMRDARGAFYAACARAGSLRAAFPGLFSPGLPTDSIPRYRFVTTLFVGSWHSQHTGLPCRFPTRLLDLV